MPTTTKPKTKAPAKASPTSAKASKPAKASSNGTANGAAKVTVVTKTPPPPTPAKSKAPKAPAADASLCGKLGIVTGTCVVLIDAPTSFPPKLDPLPDDVELRHSAMRGAGFDISILFVPNVNTLNRRFSQLAKLMRPGGSVWVAWPSRMTDLKEETVRPVGVKEGLVDNKVIVIDQNWSAMRFVAKA
jgi:hypothetical protein